ncbi:MAG: hypothetical protein E7230_02300 [Clostridiales bacterium]|nr:hypothetical protein [Clostridiales bacterium]
MNNKRGGFGAKLLLVLILMIASAIGGAYGYRVLDGKLAARDALKAVENVDVSDYDTPEQAVIQECIDEAKKALETAKTRKEVYEIISDFVKDVGKVKTRSEKELEAALQAAEEAKQQNGTTDPTENTYDSGGDGTQEETDETQYKSNDLPTGTNETQNGGLIDSLFGKLFGGSE